MSLLMSDFGRKKLQREVTGAFDLELLITDSIPLADTNFDLTTVEEAVNMSDTKDEDTTSIVSDELLSEQEGGTDNDWHSR